MGLENYINFRAEKLYFYAPYNFIRDIEKTLQFEIFIKNRIEKFKEIPNNHIIEVTVENDRYFFLVTFLSWDSDFFKIPTYKLFTVLYEQNDFSKLCKAIRLFKESMAQKKGKYLFAEIPSEDIILVQALTKSGFKMVETRLTFYKDELINYRNERYPVRFANNLDIEALRRIAKSNRNDYDRLHADVFFDSATADNYVAQYAQNALEGFCDAVIVPDENKDILNAFMVISYAKDDINKIGKSIAKIVLTAVSPENKGWHYKLTSETIFEAKSRQANYVIMTTQSTNRAVVRTAEKLDFKLGGTSHIFVHLIK